MRKTKAHTPLRVWPSQAAAGTKVAGVRDTGRKIYEMWRLQQQEVVSLTAHEYYTCYYSSHHGLRGTHLIKLLTTPI